jgi:hypothetical protein
VAYSWVLDSKRARVPDRDELHTAKQLQSARGLVELTKTSKTKVFAQALATNAAAPVAAAGQMVMHPVETV